MKLHLQKIKQAYGDMKLESKFTLVLILAVTIPVILMGCFFYGNVYEMVVSYTIRQEQDVSAKTAPLIEESLQQVIDAHDTITDLDFFQTLFHQPVNSPFKMFDNTSEVKDFHDQVEQLISSKKITGLQIYIDLPGTSMRLFQNELTRDYFAPMSRARGTYWYGIFQGTHNSTLYCPPFYLGQREIQNLGDMAYITATTFYYQGVAYPAYIATYFSGDNFTRILQDNLTLSGSVSYIVNDRNAVVASSDISLSGIYWLDYSSILDSFMSSNNFIERDILDTKVYAGFYNIKQAGWFMVTVLPSGPLIHQSNMIMFQYFLLFGIFLIMALLLSHFIAHSVTRRISSVIAQMSQVRKGTLSPMESPVYHDEVGDLISDIPDELTEYQIPKLTLQPIIENAILHGILEKSSKSGTIVLTGWMEDEDIVLLISDDGVGIPPDLLKNIVSGEVKSSSGGTNIAIYNTHKRLQILYGENYGLKYSSTPGQGTEVEIRIPARRQSPVIDNT